jgi:hypothetical protein
MRRLISLLSRLLRGERSPRPPLLPARPAARSATRLLLTTTTVTPRYQWMRSLTFSSMRRVP